MDIQETPEQIAAKLALAFHGSRERVVEKRIIDDFGRPTLRFPRYEEEVFPKTVEEIAESEAVICFISSNQLLQERPLTFMEIVEKLEELGYAITPKETS
jgi:hypothetical protein